MKLGIKVGPQPTSIDDLRATQPSFCEVWFHIANLSKYDGLFEYLDTHRIETGLHYWGALNDGTWTTLAYPDREILDGSMRLMKQTIDIAAKHNFRYVNIHPGSRAKIYIDIATTQFVIRSTPADIETAQEVFNERIVELNEYANKHNVLLTVETVPLRVFNRSAADDDGLDRKVTHDIFEMPISCNHAAQALGVAIANDFGHTAAGIIDPNPETVWQFVRTHTAQLAASTRLIHLAFIVPPYNGTDIHDSLENPLIGTDAAIPNKNQMIALLQMFQKRPDVYLLVEPKKDHQKNYHIAKEILKTAGVFDE